MITNRQHMEQLSDEGLAACILHSSPDYLPCGMCIHYEDDDPRVCRSGESECIDGIKRFLQCAHAEPATQQ